MLLGLALVWSKELVRGRSERPLNCDLLVAAEPRRQSVVRVVTVDFFYRRAPAYSAELKPGNLVRVVASVGHPAPRRPRPLGRGVLSKHQLLRPIRGGSVCARALTDPAALGAASLLVLDTFELWMIRSGFGGARQAAARNVVKVNIAMII